MGAFSPNRLEVPDVERFEGRGVYYYVRDKSVFKDKNLLIVGGGDSACDWALGFCHYAKKVTLIHRRDVFRAHEDTVAQVKSSDVEMKLFYELKSLIADGDTLKGAVIFDNRTMVQETIVVDVILVNIGFRADLGPIKDWGLRISGRELLANGKLETNIPGVFVAGDIAMPEDSVKVNLIATAFAQAAIAVNVAKNYIDPKASVFPGHTSEMQR